MSNYERADIVLIPFPYTDLTIGKLRPAIIISNDKLNNSQDRICCLITSQPETKGIEIKTEDVSQKLPFQSWVKPQRVFTISQHIIKKKITTATTQFCDTIVKELNMFVN